MVHGLGGGHGSPDVARLPPHVSATCWADAQYESPCRSGAAPVRWLSRQIYGGVPSAGRSRRRPLHPAEGSLVHGGCPNTSESTSNSWTLKTCNRPCVWRGLMSATILHMARGQHGAPWHSGHLASTNGFYNCVIYTYVALQAAHPGGDGRSTQDGPLL
jgi:hypothetical protein